MLLLFNYKAFWCEKLIILLKRQKMWITFEVIKFPKNDDVAYVGTY